MAKHKKNDDEFEPGAAQFGNFINYYEFNPPKNRLALFEGKFCEYFSSDKRKILCLDIGCNTGVSFSILTLTIQFLFMFRYRCKQFQVAVFLDKIKIFVITDSLKRLFLDIFQKV